MSVTVSRIEIENVKGIAHAELKMAGRALTVLKGSNGSGKSSILDAIASIFEGGSDPSLIRQGAKSARVRIELSDGKTIEKLQTAKNATLKVTDENGEPVGSPKEYVDALAKSFAFDPLSFLRADKKSRADFAAKHTNMTFTGKEIGSLKLGKLDIAAPLREIVDPNKSLDLTAFDALRKTVYERRRVANVAVTELDKTVLNLRKSLPAEMEAGVGMEDVLGGLRAKLAEINAAEKADMDVIEGQVKEAINEARETYEQACEAARAARDAALADIREGEIEAVGGLRQERAPSREDLQRAIGEAEGNLKRAGELKALSTHLEQQRERLAEKSEESDRLTQALNALDALRKSKLDKFPVQGVEFRDGECFRDGIPFDQLNQARQYVTSLEIGALGLGELPLIVADEAEHLDENEWKSFCAAVEESGLQLIAARVDIGPLRADPQGSLIA